jgi:hypothetical protein
VESAGAQCRTPVESKGEGAGKLGKARCPLHRLPNFSPRRDVRTVRMFPAHTDGWRFAHEGTRHTRKGRKRKGKGRRDREQTGREHTGSKGAQHMRASSELVCRVRPCVSSCFCASCVFGVGRAALCPLWKGGRARLRRAVVRPCPPSSARPATDTQVSSSLSLLLPSRPAAAVAVAAAAAAGAGATRATQQQATARPDRRRAQSTQQQKHTH